MKSLFQFFGLSFFSDKIAKEAPKRGFAFVIIALLLSFVFFLFGYMAADVVPFSGRYNNASDYREFLHGAFENGLTLTVESGRGKSAERINTYTSEEDAARFQKNGYHLISDTRSSTTFIKFSQTAVKGEARLSYEEYLSLSDEEKKGYELKTDYSDEELVLTAEDTERFAAYLSEITAEGAEGYNEKAATDFEKARALEGEEYKKEIYALYVRYYYTGVTSPTTSAGVPVLRDYYYINYVAGGASHYFFIFDDMCAGSFQTDGGVPAVFGGYFKNAKDGAVTEIDEFIKSVYYATVSATMTSYFVSAMSLLPSLVMFPILLSLITFGVRKAVKNGWEKSFAGNYKIVNSFVWVSALLTAIFTFIFGFIGSARRIYGYMPLIFGGILVIRTAVFCVLQTVKNGRDAKMSAAEKAAEEEALRREAEEKDF